MAKSKPLDLPPEVGNGPKDEAPPRPRTADPSPVPRVIGDGERAPEGLRRFKLRAELEGVNGPGTRYVLARDRQSAERCYREANRIDEQARVRFVVTELPD